MSTILIRAAQDPTTVHGAMASAQRMGANSGNLLYANAVARTLAARSNKVDTGAFDAHLVDRASWIRRINKRYDHFVVPLANAFRYKNGEALEGLTELVRGLDVPVTVVTADRLLAARVAKAGPTVGPSWLLDRLD